MMLWGIFTYFPKMKLTVDALQAGNDVYILTPTTWDPHTDIHATNEDCMLDWEGNIKEKREWTSQVALEDVDDHINTSSLVISAVEMKAIDDEMMHCECEEEETIKYSLPWIDMSVIPGILTVLNENVFSQMLTESGQLSREKMIIGATTANDSPYLVDSLMIRRDTMMTTVTPNTVMMTVTPKAAMMREVHKMMTMNKLTTMTSMKYLLLHRMYQGQEPWMPSIFPILGLSMRIQRGHWM